MDPVSFVTTVASLAAFAETVFSNVFKYAKEVKESQKELAQLSSEIATLAGVLRGSDLLLRELKSSAITEEQINECWKLLQSINDRLDKFKPSAADDRGMKRFVKRLRWPFTLPYTKELLQKNRATKGSI